MWKSKVKPFEQQPRPPPPPPDSPPSKPPACVKSYTTSRFSRAHVEDRAPLEFPALTSRGCMTYQAPPPQYGSAQSSAGNPVFGPGRTALRRKEESRCWMVWIRRFFWKLAGREEDVRDEHVTACSYRVFCIRWCSQPGIGRTDLVEGVCGDTS